ncbi:MAG: ATP-grasp domain-containing protein [Solirubrobacteraceae bacterium]
MLYNGQQGVIDPAERSQHLALAPQRKSRATPEIGVVVGADAMRVAAARETETTLRKALQGSRLSFRILHTGRGLAHDLGQLAAGVVLPAVLDVRIEDGGLQDLLEALKIAYVGSPPASVRACADKAITAQILRQAGLTVPSQCVISNQAIVELGIGASLTAVTEQLGAEVVVKPRHGSAGLGVKLVGRTDTIASAILSSLNYDRSIVVEQFIVGTEMSALVMGPSETPSIEGLVRVLNPQVRNWAYAGWARQYTPRDDHDLDDAAVATAVCAAYSALGCRGAATVDFVVDAMGTPWIFDVDTELNFASTQKLVVAAKEGGRSVQRFVHDLLQGVAAASRHRPAA